MLDNEFPDSISIAELYMLPPDFNLSDEVSYDKEERQSLNQFSGKQFAAPAEIVIHASTNQNNHVDHYHDSAQDKPRSKKNKKDQQSAWLKHLRN